jgi:hypothetical protein
MRNNEDRLILSFATGVGGMMIFAVVASLFGEGWWVYIAAGAGFIFGVWLHLHNEKKRRESVKLKVSKAINTHCMGCGTEKNLDKLESYPYHEDGITDRPIAPLMDLDCVGKTETKRVRICHECFHKLSPDMWINQNGWEFINPVISFSELTSDNEQPSTRSQLQRSATDQ